MTKKLKDKISQDKLHKNFVKTKNMHNDWELYENKREYVLCRKQYNTKYYSIGAKGKK